MGPRKVSAGRSARVRVLALAAAPCLDSAAGPFPGSWPVSGTWCRAAMRWRLRTDAAGAGSACPHDWWGRGGRAAFPSAMPGRLAVDVPAAASRPSLLAERLRTALRLDRAYGSPIVGAHDRLAERDPSPTCQRGAQCGAGPGSRRGHPALDPADAVVSTHPRLAWPGLPGAALALSKGGSGVARSAARAVNIVRLYREGWQSRRCRASARSISRTRLVGHWASRSTPGSLRRRWALSAMSGRVSAMSWPGCDHVLFILILLVGAASPPIRRASLAFSRWATRSPGCAGAPGDSVRLPGSRRQSRRRSRPDRLCRSARLDWIASSLAGTMVFCVGLGNGFGFHLRGGRGAGSSRSFLGLVVGFNLGIEAGSWRFVWLPHRSLFTRCAVTGSAIASAAQPCAEVVCPCTASFWLLERGAVAAEV